MPKVTTRDNKIERSVGRAKGWYGRWNQGNIYLVDEVSGASYNQITAAPIIGPLFSKPRIIIDKTLLKGVEMH